MIASKYVKHLVQGYLMGKGKLTDEGNKKRTVISPLLPPSRILNDASFESTSF